MGKGKKINTNDINSSGFQNKIKLAEIQLIHHQIPIGIITALLLLFIVAFTFYQFHYTQNLIFWISCILISAVLWVYSFLVYPKQFKLNLWNLWLKKFAFVVFVTGCSWGLLGFLLIPKDSILMQTFITVILVGITAGVASFFSPIPILYLLCIIPLLAPFIFWLFLHSGIHIFLGLSILLFMIVMIGISFNQNQFLKTSFLLRFKNLDLDTLNRLLEKRIKKKTQELNKSLSVIASTLESTADGIVVIDKKGTIELYNQKFLAIWDISERFINKKNKKTIFRCLMKKLNNKRKFIQQIKELRKHPNFEKHGEISFSTKEKTIEWYSKPHQNKNRYLGRVWGFREITLRKKMENQLEYMANHDLLTQLPNKSLLYDRLKTSISHADRFKMKLVVFFLDIDNFKMINDNLGHDVGDQLLKIIANRLKHAVRQGDTVARFGGDEFIILFLTNNLSDLNQLGDKLLDKVSQPIYMNQLQLFITASIGASIYPRDGVDANTLIKNADVAMYSSKNHGKNHLRTYQKETLISEKRKFNIQMDLHAAIKRKEFYVLYQPIVDLQTGNILSIEALVRWQHPLHGILLPEEFIPYAEETGLIIPLGEWIFHQACEQFKIWQKTGLNPHKIAINISAIQLKNRIFVDFLKQTLKEIELAPHHVELELVESSLMESSTTIYTSIKELSNLGINIIIDDFGKGYSSINYVREFPISKLKIDRSFILNCIHNKEDAAIVKTIIDMGHNLNVDIIAEGIENTQQNEFLLKQDCHEGQGFLFSPPVSAGEMAFLLKRKSLFNKQKP